MRKGYQDGRISSLEFQRNVFFAFSLVLSFSVLLLSSFLFLKNERVVITPAVVEREFWVDSKGVSATYLEQYSLFLSNLILGKTAESSPGQKEVLVRHVDVRLAQKIRGKLEEEEVLLREENASYVFFPVEIRTYPEKLSSVIVGDRTFYVDGRQVSTERQGYEMVFSYEGGRLLLTALRQKEL